MFRIGERVVCAVSCHPCIDKNKSGIITYIDQGIFANTNLNRLFLNVLEKQNVKYILDRDVKKVGVEQYELSF